MRLFQQSTPSPPPGGIVASARDAMADREDRATTSPQRTRVHLQPPCRPSTTPSGTQCWPVFRERERLSWPEIQRNDRQGVPQHGKSCRLAPTNIIDFLALRVARAHRAPSIARAPPTVCDGHCDARHARTRRGFRRFRLVRASPRPRRGFPAARSIHLTLTATPLGDIVPTEGTRQMRRRATLPRSPAESGGRDHVASRRHSQRAAIRDRVRAAAARKSPKAPGVRATHCRSRPQVGWRSPGVA